MAESAVEQDPFDGIDVERLLRGKLYQDLAPGAVAEDVTKKPFDMEYVRNAPSLETEVIEDWRPVVEADEVRGSAPMLQKRIRITVCEIWPGRKWRVPVRLIAPVEGRIDDVQVHSCVLTETDLQQMVGTALVGQWKRKTDDP